MAKISVQQMAAVASEIPSAAYTPGIPMKRGRISASGMSNITLRNRATVSYTHLTLPTEA